MAKVKIDDSTSIPDTIQSLTQFFFPFVTEDKKEEKLASDFNFNELDNF